MCGIVGAVAERDVAAILLEGLRRLEYRGYDSAGIVTLTKDAAFDRVRSVGKVKELASAMEKHPLHGSLGIAHTRWATHGKPSEKNAHPHICQQTVAVVHNGIIENYEELKSRQLEQGFIFTSETDTEVIAHLVYFHLEQTGDLLKAVQRSIQELRGAFALGVISTRDPNRLVAARKGSPLVVGLGFGENFIASDVPALLPVTQRFVFLEEGDLADIRLQEVHYYNGAGIEVQRQSRESDLSIESVDRGKYRHFMQKEIFEQPVAITNTLEGRITQERVIDEILGVSAKEILAKTERVQIIACGTSYHAGMVARYWLEAVGIPCAVEVASEFRYRPVVVQPGTLFLTLSQSGETADTLAALREAKTQSYVGSLTICNAPESSLVRESDLCLLTRAGPEIGVASTKAFTTQLVSLLMLVALLGRRKGFSAEQERELVSQLRSLPAKMKEVLDLEDQIIRLSEQFADKSNALFLGRGSHYPIAMEGALKLKEISYIHAEAYPAGELKHGPLALVDATMPVVVVAPKDGLLEKLKGNLEEVRARGGQLFVFADSSAALAQAEGIHMIKLPPAEDWIAPILYTLPLQMLAYHVAVLRGTDVDQPRNLAKSVTVE